MIRSLLIPLAAAAILYGPAGLHAAPKAPGGSGVEDIPAALPVVDTSLVRGIPAPQQLELEGWINKLRAYYTAVSRSENIYLNFCGTLLPRNGLPQELKLISLIESDMNPAAQSEDGALGIWQLMPAAATENNLSLAPYDERRDIYKSSHAALSVIRALYKKFGNQLLVVAAYNCGAGRVSGVLGGASNRSYWDIHAQLPAETQNHVLKYLAAMVVFYNLPFHPAMGAPVFARTSTSASAVKKTKGGLATIQITASYREREIIRYTGISPKAFLRLNPDLARKMAKQGYYDLKLPHEHMMLFIAQKSQILKSSLSPNGGGE